MASAEDWENAGCLLQQMTDVYTRDNLRKLAFNSEIFPLVLRFENGERSEDLLQSILESEKSLMQNIDFISGCPGGFFINPGMKPSHSDIMKVLGTEELKWRDLSYLLRVHLRLKRNLRFCNKLDVWLLEFSQIRKIRIALIPDKDNFRIKIPLLIDDYLNSKSFSAPSEIYPLIHKYVKAIPEVVGRQDKTPFI